MFASDFAIDSDGTHPRGCFALLEDQSGLAHGVSTREGPDFASPADGADHAEAAATFARALGLDAAAWLRQVHSARVLRASEPGLQGEADALVTDRPGLALLGRSADCPLILAVAEGPDRRPLAVGVAHASWRGTVARVTDQLLLELLALSGREASHVRAAIAPSAGPCCYEVGSEVREAALASLGIHAEDYFLRRGKRLIFDLWRANADALVRAGVPASQVVLAGRCTICENTRFHSWRRDGAAAGRFVGAIGILPPLRSA